MYRFSSLISLANFQDAITFDITIFFFFLNYSMIRQTQLSIIRVRLPREYEITFYSTRRNLFVPLKKCNTKEFSFHRRSILPNLALLVVQSKSKSTNETAVIFMAVRCRESRKADAVKRGPDPNCTVRTNTAALTPPAAGVEMVV